MGVLGYCHEKMSQHNLGTHEALQHYEELKRHMGDILPTPDDLGHLKDAAHIKSISLKTLQVSTFGLYNIQFTVTIQHDVPLRPKTIREITEIIFESGANSPITIDEFPNYFLYPYESSEVVVSQDELVGQGEGCNDNSL
jgi:hypothetical protein